MQIFSALQILQVLITSLVSETTNEAAEFLKKEDGFYLLKEDGGKIII